MTGVSAFYPLKQVNCFITCQTWGDTSKMGVCPENDPDLGNRDPNGLNGHIKVNFYRPQTKFGQGNIFRSVCHSVHWGEGSAYRSVCLWGVSLQGGLPLGGSASRGSASGICLQRGSASRGVCLRGVCIQGVGRPPRKKADGTHPTRIRVPTFSDWQNCMIFPLFFQVI